MSKEVRERLKKLRSEMKKSGTQWYFMTTADPHGSTYLPDFYREREAFSGFSGSNGDLLVGNTKAYLWTDGRYFLQAEKQLEGNGIELMRIGEEGVPTVAEFLASHVKKGSVLRAEGTLITSKQGREFSEIMAKAGGSFLCDENLTMKAWPVFCFETSGVFDDTRFGLEMTEIETTLGKLFDRDVPEKLKAVRGRIKEQGADTLILSRSEDQMWLYNLRGHDVEESLCAYCYSIITKDRAYLYLRGQEDPGYFKSLTSCAGKKGYEVRPYESFYKDLISGRRTTGKVLLDLENCNYAILKILQEQKREIIDAANPTELLKAVKTGKELDRIREIYLQDSLILTRFLKNIKEHIGDHKTYELEAAYVLDEMRKSESNCMGTSFPTISASGANAALMHYDCRSNPSLIKNNTVYLVDSGGQYHGGTTDVTRTLILGKVSKKLREHFTAVARGMLSLQNAVFLKGCTGRNLDILARKPIWDLRIDYKCGTGHGIGYMQNVHEGPHYIRMKQSGMRPETELLPGMLVSDEPGIYLEGKYGIRLENILLVTEKEKNEHGTFYGFEPLTLVPIDLDGIDTDLLSAEEKKQLNAYHALVRKKLLPYLSKEEAAWLKHAARAV